MVSRFFIILCLLFFIVILMAISYSIQINTVKEGLFSNLTQCSEAKSLSTPSNKKSSNNIQNTKGRLPLSQYHIFASWNSACSGKFVSTQQIQNVLTTGCRFLDFPITDVSGEPMICAPRFTNDISTNYITLGTAVRTCMENAFQHHIVIDYKCSASKTNKSNSQKFILNNYDDPLFIQLRFEDSYNNDDDDDDKKGKKNHNDKKGKKNHNDKKIEKFLNKVSEIFGHITKEHKYRNYKSKDLPTDIPLNELKNKVVLLVDITGVSTMAFENSHLQDITNLVVGHNSGVMMYPFQILLNSVPQNIPSNNSSSDYNDNLDFYVPIDQYTMAIPDVYLKTQPTIQQVFELAAYHNAQFVPFLFYQQNSLLTDYIDFFQQKQSAFIPIQSLNKILLQDSKQAVMG